ncbi:MAG: DUF5110 domain-containing protein [Verrucomicrobiales bacterium]|nr:DUF5110 domain-containing protein [Verrucomicrobiales bacterium]
MPKHTTRHRPSPAPTVDPSSAADLRLDFDGLTFGVEALSDDLMRVRISQHNATPIPPSWAVRSPFPAKPTVPPRVGQRRHVAELATPEATLRIRLADGSWEFSDRYGWTVFQSTSSITGVFSDRARLALRLEPREAIFGLGETTGTFNRRGTIREFWNSDVLGHAPCIHPHLRQLYASIPFALSLRDGRAAGLFWDFPGRQIWDIGSTHRDVWSLQAPADHVDLYLFAGPTPYRVVQRFTDLTGRHWLLPRWALGYHQSRYSYVNRAELESVARQLRRRQIPCDAVYCDIHHQDKHRVFTFGRSFPRPAAMIAGLARRGFRVVAIVNPGVKNDPSFGVLRRGLRHDAFVKTPSGRRDFIGRVWPGDARFPDFTRSKVRDWWSSEQRALLRLGIAGIWNDMNEPAVFDRADKTLDPQCLHHTDTGPRRHGEIHNVYGQLMAQACHQGLLQGTTNSTEPTDQTRPFVITRAGYAGMQRHAILWTGDNSAAWSHLDDALQMLLNLGLSGVGFCGADVGGFLENCSAELFVRWLQMAIFTPFLRNHSNLDTARQEPWAFGPETEELARRYLNLRYQLLPYLYGLLEEMVRHGTPMMRPLLWRYPNDPVAVACGDQFLLGDALLVAPVLRQGSVARCVYLPQGEWFDFWTGQRLVGGAHRVAHAPLDIIPLFIRAGSLLPLAARRSFVGPTEPETVFLHVWPGDDGRLDWYDDDGRSRAHETGGWYRRSIHHHQRSRGGRLVFDAATGTFPSSTRTWRIALRGQTRPIRVALDREVVGSHFDAETGLVILDIPNRRQAFSVDWR